MTSLDRNALLATFENLARYHREHEKYYSEAPLHDAARLQQASRTLKALAERWQAAAPSTDRSSSPYAGATDVNDERAIETSGVLFLESGEKPAEVTRIEGELATTAESAESAGEWLATAMDRSWSVVRALLEFPELVDLLGERHQIIANDWRGAETLKLVARQLRRALEILGRVDMTLEGLRADLGGESRSAAYVFAAAELIDQAADLTAMTATLAHQNERRWRVFQRRLDQLLAVEPTAQTEPLS